MKKAMLTVCIIAACAALCACLWPRSGIAEQTPMVKVEDKPAEEVTPTPAQAKPPQTEEPSPILPEAAKAEEKVTADASPQIVAATQTPAPLPQVTQSAQPSGYAPYHTDVYPNNVYSEEYTYDENGKLISKSVTMPETFGPETIWIDGHAYADVPGFGLVEWSGPSKIVEVYDMVPNRNQIGIMGGDDEVSGEYAVPKATPECVYYTPEELANGRPPMPTTSNKPVVPDDYSPSVIAG